MGKSSAARKTDDTMFLLKSAAYEEKPDGQYLKLYITPEELTKFAEEATEKADVAASTKGARGQVGCNVRVDLHLRERESKYGDKPFVSGFMFLKVADGQGYNNGKGKPTGFKPKATKKVTKKIKTSKGKTSTKAPTYSEEE